MTYQLLEPHELRRTVVPTSLGFSVSSELVQLELPWIGQERAAASAVFGLNMEQSDYNLFVLGNFGSGRSSLLQKLMHEQATLRSVPPDLCYLHNFDSPDHPIALRLPSGEGRLLRELMGQLAKNLQKEIPKWLTSPDFKIQQDRIINANKLEDVTDYGVLSQYAETHQFVLIREDGNMVFTYKDDKGELMTPEKNIRLTREQRAAIDLAEEALQDEIGKYLDLAGAKERSLNEALNALQRRYIKPMLDRELQVIRNGLRKQIKDTLKLRAYLDQVHLHTLNNLEVFEPCEDEEARLNTLVEFFSCLRVNIVVDNHDLKGAPVVVEENCSQREIFGGIDYETDEDVLITDFSRIRAGSLMKAHGGFLMLHMRDVLADSHVWAKLRRFLRTGKLQVEEAGLSQSAIPSVSMRPESVDIDVKIVLIASVEEYYAVYELDAEFARHFRCKVDFVDSFIANSDSHYATAIFVSHTCKRLGLLDFSVNAVARIVEESHRLTEDQTRQSANFGALETLIIESSALADARKASTVDLEDVIAAHQARILRHNSPEQRLQASIVEGDRLIDITGEKVAQLNGLTVIDQGDYEFGFPVRITARTYAGEEGLLNIEREVEMSGPIHDKGVLILQSYLNTLFRHIAPLAMNAAVVFEQEYSGVEGDSASCAEFYALLSSLSGLPLKQGIAVTGALNQRGEMLPVGGINEKIEGYFKTCELLGLDGTQGVLIPRRNRRHLMLSPQVIHAVEKNLFKIYTIESASAGMELLTGLPFGSDVLGFYRDDTVLGLAQRTLKKYRSSLAINEKQARNHKHGHVR